MAVVNISRSVKIVFFTGFILLLVVNLGSIVADCDNCSSSINIFNDCKFSSTFDNDVHYWIPVSVISCSAHALITPRLFYCGHVCRAVCLIDCVVYVRCWHRLLRFNWSKLNWPRSSDHTFRLPECSECRSQSCSDRGSDSQQSAWFLEPTVATKASSVARSLKLSHVDLG